MRRILKTHGGSEPIELETAHAQIVVFSAPASNDGSLNEDAAGVWEVGEGAVIVAVADGMGGGPDGAHAAAVAVDALDRALAPERADQPLRGSLIDAFEVANRQLIEEGIGAGTTLVVVELVGGIVRSYHAGDSGAILAGQRGRVKMETVNHSPTGYGVASGLLDREASQEHRDRHYLSNCVGATDMRIEIGPPVPMAARDTLFLASDGVLDNVRHERLIECIRKGPLRKAAAALCKSAREAMEGESPDLPALPDDATGVLLRQKVRGGRETR